MIMTELQKKQFEMLKLFVDICDKLNLTYFLVCGSALGAVKYKGFIPWDDDIDVALPRKDYNIFIANAEKILPNWCFLQNYKTDPEFHLLGSKLRDSRTTFIEYTCEKLNINHGVFIDIFPLDGLWCNNLEKRKYIKARKKFESVRRVRLNYNRISRENIFRFRDTFVYLLYKIFGLYSNTAKTTYSFDTLVSSFSIDKSQMMCNFANSTSNKEYADIKQYGHGIDAYFEGLKVKVPFDYDSYLSQKYGDWKNDLPKEKQVGHHNYKMIDLNNSYKSYLNRYKKGEENDK